MSKPKACFSINLVENRDNELLFLRRSENAELGPGLWGFPAGHREAGETPEDCAIRELGEEIGLQAGLRQRQAKGPIRDSHYGGIYEIHLFHWQWLGGEIRLNHEHSDYRWIGRENYRGLHVMDGVDEDILYLGIWPRACLNQDKLPHG